MENFLSNGPNESLELFITSDVNTTGTVTIPQQGWSSSFSVTANTTTSVPVPNDLAEHFTAQIVDNRGVFIETQDTVSVFAINVENFTADGTKILPVEALGTEYRIIAYEGLPGELGSEFVVVATEDDTEIEIIPTAATTGGNLPGVPFTVSLDAGGSYMVQSEGSNDLTGTLLKGTELSGPCRPFAVFSGAYCALVPTTCVACDHLFEQNFPTQFWGDEYFIVPFDLADSYTYRIVAQEDNTTVTIDGTVSYTMNAGEFLEFNDQDQVHCLDGTAPFCAVQYMEGIQCAGNGDPAMVILNSSDQKIDNVTFSTIESTVIDTHYMTLIAETGTTSNVQFDGALLQSGDFSPIPSCQDHSYLSMPITEGSHTVVAPAGVTCYVYGNGMAESYAYSAGSYQGIETIVEQVDSLICSNVEVELATPIELFDIEWYAQSDPEIILSTDPTLTLTPPIESDVYVATGNLFISGCPDSAMFLVESPEPPLIELDFDYAQICQYESIQLGVSSLDNTAILEYSWSPIVGLDDPTSPNPIAIPLDDITYTVTVSTPTGCGEATTDVTIDVAGGTVTGVTAAVSDDLICEGDEVEFSAQAGTVVFEDNFNPGVSWGLWCEVLNGAQSMDCGSVSGNAMYFNGNGQRSATTNAIDVSTGEAISFALKVGSGTAPCDDAEVGEDIIVEYSTSACSGPFTEIATLNEANYAEFTTVTLPIPMAAQTNATHFRVRQVSNSGINQDNWVIDDFYVSSLDVAGYNYQWTSSGTLADEQAQITTGNPVQTGWNYVEMTENSSGCSYLDSVWVDVQSGANLEVPSDTTLCDIQGIELYANPELPGNYDWTWTTDYGTFDDNQLQSPTFNTTQTSLVNIAVGNEAGCVTEASLVVTVNELLDLEIAADDTSICLGEEVNLTSDMDEGADVTYAWVPADLMTTPEGANTTATPTIDTTVVLIVTDLTSGCSLSDEVFIYVGQPFDIELTNDTALCDMIGFQLSASTTSAQAIDWVWSPAENVDDAFVANPSIIMDETVEFTLIATPPSGCVQDTTLTVELLTETFELGENQTACEGDIVTLDTAVDPSFTFEWTTNDNTPAINVTTSNTYGVTVESPAGCVHYDEVVVTFEAAPAVDLPEEMMACEGEIIEVDAGNAGSSFEWSDDQSDQVGQFDTAGNYTVIVTNEFDCSSSDSIELVFSSIPLPIDENFLSACEGETVAIDAGNPDASFVWNTNETTQVITVGASGWYSVTIENASMCTVEDSVQVEIIPYPIIDLGPDTTACDGEFITLQVAAPGAFYSWSTGDTGAAIDVEDSGIYAVQADLGGCVTEDEVLVEFFDVPEIIFTEDTTACFVGGDPLVLDLGELEYDIEWETGETKSLLEVFGAGRYTVTLTNEAGCSLVHSVWVEEVCVGTLFVPNSFTADQDGLNEGFRAEGHHIEEFHMEIWDRWGEKIWESNDISEYWTGNVNGGEHYADSETFIYFISYRTRESDGAMTFLQRMTGYVTLIR